jgi:hypothetical protein
MFTLEPSQYHRRSHKIETYIATLLKAYPCNANCLSFVRELDLPFAEELRAWIDEGAREHVEHVSGQEVKRTREFRGV